MDDGQARLADLAATSAAVRATSGRLEKRRHLAALFAQLGPRDLRLAASYLAGEIPQGRVGVGPGQVFALPARPPPPEPGTTLPLFGTAGGGGAAGGADGAPASPTLDELDGMFDALQAVSGAGASRRRATILLGLLDRLAPDEHDLLTGLVLGELRQGALRALVIEGLAQALAVPEPALRRAVMFTGEPGVVAEAVRREGAGALDRFGPTVLRPIEPMLAASSPTVEDALAELGGTAAVEWKLDGIRIQLHRDGDEVRIFTRSLRDVTDGLPELVATARSLPARSFVLDGEAIAMHAGAPVPFQDLMSRFSRELEEQGGVYHGRPLPLLAQFFDLLLLDGAVLLDLPYRERCDALARLVPEELRVQRRVAAAPEEARAVFDAALAAGHEGVLVKGLDAPYQAGRRGAQWRKVKPSITLDLVILAAEWGHGRRRGFLSNLHLGAREAVPGAPDTFRMLGKTFKGLTDAMLRAQTEDLQSIARERTEHVVYVHPVRVVEIAFDLLQRSRRYDSGFGLRFARVKRFRPDKSAADATTMDDIRAIYEAQRKLGAH